MGTESRPKRLRFGVKGRGSTDSPGAERDPGMAAIVHIQGLTPVPAINFNAAQTRAGDAIPAMVGNPVGSLTVQCDIPSGTTNMLLDLNGYFQ